VPFDETTRDVAEFGVVFLMFSIGLEFSLPQLRAMRRAVFGLGLAQVAITTVGRWWCCISWGTDGRPDSCSAARSR
jgi:Kef-type K+ transport system membrane component KefB